MKICKDCGCEIKISEYVMRYNKRLNKYYPLPRCKDCQRLINAMHNTGRTRPDKAIASYQCCWRKKSAEKIEDEIIRLQKRIDALEELL